MYNFQGWTMYKTIDIFYNLYPILCNILVYIHAFYSLINKQCTINSIYYENGFWM